MPHPLREAPEEGLPLLEETSWEMMVRTTSTVEEKTLNILADGYIIQTNLTLLWSIIVGGIDIILLLTHC